MALSEQQTFNCFTGNDSKQSWQALDFEMSKTIEYPRLGMGTETRY